MLVTDERLRVVTFGTILVDEDWASRIRGSTAQPLDDMTAFWNTRDNNGYIRLLTPTVKSVSLSKRCIRSARQIASLSIFHSPPEWQPRRDD